MPEIWIPSDDLLDHDAIARQKIAAAFAPPDLAAHGIKLSDVEDEDANAAAAAIVLASLGDDAVAAGASGACEDDDELDDPDDPEPVAGEV